MGEYVDVGGLKTWYDTAGSTGQPLVLLHGGFATNDFWGSQIAVFAQSFRVFAPERRGHGHTPDVDGPITYDVMASDTITFLESVVTEPAHLVGWSDGGNVALLVAMSRPDLVRKIVAIGANYDTAGLIGGVEEVGEPDSPEMAMLRMMYEAASPDGPEHWPVVFAKIKDCWDDFHIERDDLAKIAAPTLVVSGDDDMITLEHTVDLYRAVPGAELAVVPGTSHALLLEKSDLANKIVLDFLQNDPAPTILPVRRASPSASG
jgi:pimeloyl-ACP methyl ester carboxylesterase